MINYLRPSPKALAMPSRPMSDRWAASLPTSTPVSHRTPAWSHSQGLARSPVVTAHCLGALYRMNCTGELSPYTLGLAMTPVKSTSMAERLRLPCKVAYNCYNSSYMGLTDCLF